MGIIGFRVRTPETGYIGGHQGSPIGVIKADTKNLDYSSHVFLCTQNAVERAFTP